MAGRQPLPPSAPGYRVTQLSPHGLAPCVLNIHASPDELVDLSNQPGFEDSDTYHVKVYLLYDIRKGAKNVPGGQRWMIGWNIHTDPPSDVWRLLFAAPIDVHETNSGSTTLPPPRGMSVMAVTRHFAPHWKNGWGQLLIGATTLEHRRAIEEIAMAVGPQDVKKNTLTTSAQWAERILTLVARNGFFDPQIVRYQVENAKKASV